MAIHSLMMASLAAEESLLLVDNSQMPYHGNQRNQPNDTAAPPQAHCARYDDVVDLITQVELSEKFKFSHQATQATVSQKPILDFETSKTLQKRRV